MNRRPLVRAGAVALLLVVGLAGCKDPRTKISSILGRPDQFAERTVVVGGDVTGSYAANLIFAEAGAYQVDDGTGKIWVVTKNGVPEKGRRVVLKGTVAKGLKVAGESFGAVVREIERRSE